MGRRSWVVALVALSCVGDEAESCPAGFEVCDGACVNLRLDPDHCGVFWGGNGANSGCCHATYGDAASWNRAFTLDVREP